MYGTSLKMLRSDTNEVGEFEVTVTSELHAQREQRSRKDKRRLHPLEAQTQTQNRRVVLKHGGAARVAEQDPTLGERRFVSGNFS